MSPSNRASCVPQHSANFVSKQYTMGALMIVLAGPVEFSQSTPSMCHVALNRLNR